ncbi:XRE family transcriptional regulator [Desulfofundulus sp. TPOSR]|uniref:nucleoside 2-deoxyribosyltransferase n=1 Tax=Desulfofundulus sp. TPOSR TaxID=2714340 RepID=UPI00140AD431|nr:nucleoside 2-deoxyribosyltransferase [Desulfofundulus sp. TPOSR]NHM28159.1 XRE family transcriptional regulator [Desulfofundulus sp. TPOSR]
MKKVYISGALTGLQNPEKIKNFYERIAKVCQEKGLQVYLPHLNTDPEKNPDITPQEVFERDKQQVIASDLLIAYIGVPSLGVGMELAYAENSHIPIILLYERGKVISRFPRGIPVIMSEIIFNDFDDAINQLYYVLDQYKSKCS